MKTFYKVCLRVALVVIGLGILLTIIGVTSGGTLNNAKFGTKFIHRTTNTDKNNVDFNVDFDTDSDVSGEYALTESYQDVKSLDFDINFGDVTIQNGSEFKIEGGDSRYFTSQVINGVWTIDEKDHIGFNVFGLHFGDGGINVGDYDGDVTITLPQNFQADSIKLKMGAGEIWADQLKGNEVSIDVGAGDVNIENLYAYTRSEIKVGAGNVNVDTADIKDVTINCGLGNVEINGKIIGKNSVDCGVGEVTLDLVGKETDYNYYVDSGVGDVIINEDTYSMSSSTKKVTDGAVYEFDIKCGVGNIDLSIEE